VADPTAGRKPPTNPPASATDEVSVGDLMRANLSDRNSLIDSSLPTVAFLIGYLVSGSQLQPALIAAVVAGVAIAVLRAVRQESLRHIASGFIGVAIAALLANRTGRAEDFFLPGLLLNLAYAAAFAISAVVRRPLVGLGIRVMTDDGGAWRDFEPLHKAAYRATWMWAAVFALRVGVQVPLYLAGAVGALGVAKLVLGFPLFLLAAFVTHRLLSPALALRRDEDESAEPGTDARSADAQDGRETQRRRGPDQHGHQDHGTPGEE